MGEKLTNLVIAALVGGIVGLIGGVIGGSSGSAAGKTKMDELEVGVLKITKEAALFNAEGKPDVVLRDGSILANNVVFGKKFMATQLQGHVIVANRMYTTPYDLMTKPMNEWRFFTELGCSTKTGGELIVRSPNGANMVGRQTNNGFLFRTGFDENDGPQLFVRSNNNGSIVPMAFEHDQQAAEKYGSTFTAPPVPADAVPSPSVLDNPALATIPNEVQ